MKKILLAVITVFLTSCSIKSNSNLKYFPENILNIMPGPENVSYDGYEADDETYKRVEELCKDIVLFINDTYNLEWSYDTLPVVIVTDELPEGVSGNCTNGIIYIRKDASTDLIVHELIHFVTEVNRGSYLFCIECNDNEHKGFVYGGYIHEAVTQYITEEYMYSRFSIYKTNIRAKYSYFGITTFLEAIEIASPGFVRSFLHGGIEEARIEMDKLAKKYIENPSDDFFDLWLAMLDNYQVSTYEYQVYDVKSVVASIELANLICPEDRKKDELLLFNNMISMTKDDISGNSLNGLIKAFEKKYVKPLN